MNRTRLKAFTSAILHRALQRRRGRAFSYAGYAAIVTEGTELP